MHPFQQFHFCPKCGSKQFVVNDEKSKRCLDCQFVYYFNPSAATVAVILNERGEVLCTRREREPARGTLDLPGGFCDCFETSEESVVREVSEETGLCVGRTQYLFSLPDTYLYSGFLVHTVDNFFLCHVEGNLEQLQREGKLRAMDDASELMWIAPADLRSEDFGLDSIRHGIEKIKKMLNK